MEQAFELWWQSIKDDPEIISFEDLEEVMLPIYKDAMKWRAFKDTPIDKIAQMQKELDIEQIPQLYVRWLLIDGDKPTWVEYASKAMEGKK